MDTDHDSGDTPSGVSLEQINSMMRESLYWPRETLQTYQRNQLGQLLRHAKEYVPFYKNRLDFMFDGSEINWSRWNDVPILTRADLRDRPEELLSSFNPPLHGPLHTNSSSGSTGVPVTVTFPRILSHVADVAWQRFRTMHGFDFTNGFIDFRMSLPKHAPDAEHCPPAGNGKVFIILRSLPIERKLHWIAESGLKFLQDGANHAEILARANLKAGKPVQLKVIKGIGMAISDEQRALFAESFGATSIVPYSSKEGSLIAFECPHGPHHFHVCSELVMLDVVNDQGKTVPMGQPGRCIITPLLNSAQPLIRYDQGDIVVQGTQCSGGITLPVLQQIVGRQDQIFRFTGGETTFYGMDASKIRDYLGADAFQFAQTGANHLEIRYVAATDANDANFKALATYVTVSAGIQPTISIKRMPDIPFNSGGKQQRFVNEYRGDKSAT